MPKVDSPARNGVERNTLSEAEQNALELAVSRGFEDTRSLDTQTIVQKLLDYTEEITQAAEIAKAQFDQNFDGMSPKSGSFGIDAIHPGYFGYNSWANLPEFTTDADGNLENPVQTWLDNSVPDNLNGNGGVSGPLTVGENAVHLIAGIGTRADDPAVTRVNWRLNDQPRPSITTESNFRNTDIQVQWLDTPVVLKDSDDVYAEVFADRAGQEELYPVGFSFLRSKDYRLLDPEEMAGTDSSNIVVE